MCVLFALVASTCEQVGHQLEKLTIELQLRATERLASYALSAPNSMGHQFSGRASQLTGDSANRVVTQHQHHAQRGLQQKDGDNSE